MSDIVKIKHLPTGKYVSGGTQRGGVNTSKKGKTWTSVGSARTHIACHLDQYDSNHFAVIEYEMVEKQSIPSNELVKKIREQRNKRNKSEAERKRKDEIAKCERKLKQLKGE